jgi:hypothetical protein
VLELVIRTKVVKMLRLLAPPSAALLFFSLLAPHFCLPWAFAQQLPDLKVPSKGETVNMSIQNGTRSQLTFGSSTSFGSSVNMTSSEGSSTSATSSLAPSSGGSLSFSIGLGANPGTTSANIDNLRSQGAGPTTIGGASVNSSDSTFSSGKADLQGVQSKVELVLDSSRTGFQARTNTLHESYGSTPGQDKKQLTTGSQTSNATGNASVNSNMNVDINSTAFTSVFLQAF